jgi:transposase
MKYIMGIDRSQIILYPEMLDDLVKEDNPVRLLEVFVNGLDLESYGFKNATIYSWSAGAPTYSPGSMLKLFLYGYNNKVRSSRRIEKLCETNTEVMWLMERLTPDFRTISDFRKDNAKAITEVFKAFVRICAKIGLYHTEAAVQDGSKFRADNSKANNITEAKLAKRLEHAEKQLEKYLEEMDKCDKEESDEQKFTSEEIAAKVEEIKAQMGQYTALQDKMKEEGVTQISKTDPDSRLMKGANGGFDVSYNVQIGVDPVSHMVGAVEVTNDCNDSGQMAPLITQMKEDIGIEGIVEVPADKGYESAADILECLKNGIIPHVPTKSGNESYELETEYKEAEITEEMKSSTNSADIRACLEAGVLPDCYKDKGIEITITETSKKMPDETTQFVLNEEGTAVICPEGNELRKVATLSKGKTRFTNRSACSNCEDKCTTASFKQVDLSDGQSLLYGNQYRTVKTVIITLTPDKEKMRKRKCIVEHPFGTIKRYCDGTYTLLRGTVKVAADLSLLFLGYNMKRAINMIGLEELIRRITELHNPPHSV